MKKLMLMFMLSTFLVGCDSLKKKETPKEVPPQPTTKQMVVVWMPDGERIAVNSEEIIPATKSSTYQGKGEKYTRDVMHYRWVSMAGLGGGEVASNQKPMVVQTGADPQLTINADGASVAAQKQGDKFTGGSAEESWWQKVVTWIKDLGLGFMGFVIIGAVILLVFFPSLIPTIITWVQQIWSWFWTRLCEAWSVLKKDVEDVVNPPPPTPPVPPTDVKKN
jgi:hypothetical protein